MEGNRTLIVHMGLEHASDEEVKKVLRERIEKTAESGSAPPQPDWRQLPWMQRQVEALPYRYRVLDWLLSRWGRLKESLKRR